MTDGVVGGDVEDAHPAGGCLAARPLIECARRVLLACPQPAQRCARHGRTSGVGARAAGAQVRQAEQLDAAPAAAAAVTAGLITIGHAAALGKVATTGTPVQREALANPAVQKALVEVAQRQDAATYQTTVDRWAATVDPGGLERDHQAQRAERYLHITRSTAGTFLKGRLDTIAGPRLALALEALTPRPAQDDDRDPAQRRADGDGHPGTGRPGHQTRRARPAADHDDHEPRDLDRCAQ